jgi:hypothetical protein
MRCVPSAVQRVGAPSSSPSRRRTGVVLGAEKKCGGGARGTGRVAACATRHGVPTARDGGGRMVAGGGGLTEYPEARKLQAEAALPAAGHFQ